MAAAAWQLAVFREQIGRTRLQDQPLPDLAAGEALLRVERVGVTANNVTYAVLGEAYRYWDFFPTDPGWGVVPLWGFAQVVASEADGVAVGERVYGYLPSASHLVVRPGRVDAHGFRDTSAHRAPLPSPYNTYAATAADPAYDPHHEDLQVLYRPLFWTSYLLADRLLDTQLEGAEVALLSSASSKTAYGTAFLLSAAGRRVVGLTSRGNVAFTQSLGCYDLVLGYDEVAQLEQLPTSYVDVAGSGEVAAAVRSRLGASLVQQLVVGVTHQELAPVGPGSAVFFAPDQMNRRMAEWGREGFEQRFADAWQRFVPAVTGWVDVVEGHGPQALEQVWREVQSGASDPRAGHVLVL